MQRGWLVNEGLIKSDADTNHTYLAKQMKLYYYNPSEKVYDTWTDKEISTWLKDHKIADPYPRRALDISPYPDRRFQYEQVARLVACVLDQPTSVLAPPHPHIGITFVKLRTPSGVLGLTPKSVLG